MPTRELAIQVRDLSKMFDRLFGIRSIALYGGVNEEQQDEKLRSGQFSLAIGTPGRLCAVIGSLIQVQAQNK